MVLNFSNYNMINLVIVLSKKLTHTYNLVRNFVCYWQKTEQLEELVEKVNTIQKVLDYWNAAMKVKGKWNKLGQVGKVN